MRAGCLIFALACCCSASATLAQPGPLIAAQNEERNAKKIFRAGEVQSFDFGSVVRKGKIGGTAYEYRIDGNGRPFYAEIAGWKIRSRFDEMDDSESWYLIHDVAHLMVFPGSKGVWPLFCVVGHDFPGRHAMARVDSEQATLADGDECFSSQRLFLNLVSGATVRTRRYEWPHDYSVDAVGDVAHFSDAVALYTFMKATRFE